MTTVTVLAIIVSAVATGVIAVYTRKSYSLDSSLKERDDEFRQTLQDLYQAIVVATILSGPSSYGAFDDAKRTFQNHYAGTTPIFK